MFNALATPCDTVWLCLALHRIVKGVQFELRLWVVLFKLRVHIDCWQRRLQSCEGMAQAGGRFAGSWLVGTTRSEGPALRHGTATPASEAPPAAWSTVPGRSSWQQHLMCGGVCCLFLDDYLHVEAGKRRKAGVL